MNITIESRRKKEMEKSGIVEVNEETDGDVAEEAVEKSAPSQSYDPGSLSEFLKIYYKRLFPFKHYVKWLSYGQRLVEYLNRREFALVLEGDVYLRYKSFGDELELVKAIQDNNPHKIDIGGVCNVPPKEHKTCRQFEVLEREFVFDIDLTDYDDVRTCCQGGSMCSKCWRLMVIAVKLLDSAIREHLDFRHVLWVYSGRRGIHCWICDRAARQLTSAQRSALVDYLALISGNSERKRKVEIASSVQLLPDLLCRSFQIAIGLEPSKDQRSITLTKDLVKNKPLLDQFGLLIEEQGWLDDEKSWNKLLENCPDQEVQTRLAKYFEEADSSSARWHLMQVFLGDKSKLAASSAKWFLEEWVLEYCYPRLDVNVSKTLNHLLKSPFCVHPKTGKIAVPIDVKIIERFNPDSVPTVSQLTSELRNWNRENKENTADLNRKLLDYKRTVLASYVDIFESFVNGLIDDERKLDNAE